MNHLRQHELEPFIARLAARSVLGDDERAAILRLPTHMIAVRARQDFVRVNEEVAYSCFVASGLVARIGETTGGDRQITAFHIPGDLPDLHSAVRPIGVGGLTALSDAKILRIPHAAIRDLAAHYPAVAEAFWRDTMLDAAILMQWVINVGKRDARTRLAHILCEMAVRYGGDKQALLDYAFPITQEQLGEAAGLTSVHVNRCLKSLRGEGLVTIRSGQVRIPDWARLAAAGDFDSAYLVADTPAERRRRMNGAPL